jgi:PAS domain-containing protein
MDYKEITKIISENYDKGIIGGIIAFVVKKGYRFLKPKIKKLKELYYSVDKILKLQTDVNLIEEENFILRATLISVVKTAPYAMYMLDKENKLILVNNAWLNISGFNDAEEAYNFGYYKAIEKSDIIRMHQIADERIGASTPHSGTVKFKNLITSDIYECEYRTEVIKNSKKEVINYIGSLKIILIIPKKQKL